jgi:hypothetical protein
MLNLILFSQRDPKWANDLMAGGGKLKDFGCTITCLSSISTYYGLPQTPKTINKTDIYYRKTNLVDWFKMLKVLQAKSYKRVRSYNNTEVAFNVYILRKPVLVEVDAGPIGNAGGRHWVVFVGDRKCFDPFTGQITPTSKWTATGYCLINK